MYRGKKKQKNSKKERIAAVDIKHRTTMVIYVKDYASYDDDDATGDVCFVHLLFLKHDYVIIFY